MALTEAEELELLELEELESSPKQGLKQGITGDIASPYHAGIYSLLDTYALNKPSSALAALGVKALSPITGEKRSVKELYEQALADTAATEQASPTASGVGTALGIGSQLLTPLGVEKALASGVTKGEALSKIGQFVGSRFSEALPEATSALGRLARGATVGTEGAIRRGIIAAPIAGAYGADTAEQGQELEGFKTGAMYGGGIAATAPIALGGIVSGAKGVIPKIDETMRDVGRLAKRYDIPLSIDQITNSKSLKNIQKVSSQIPLSGEDAFRDIQMKAWNKQILNTVGLESDKFTPEVMDKAFTKVGKEFDRLGKGKTFQLDDDFIRSIDEIKQDASYKANKDAIENFNNAVNDLLKNTDGQGLISGEKLNRMRSTINKAARETSNPETNSMLHELENSIIEKMTNYSPEVASKFSKTKQKYKNLLVIEPLAAKSKGGNISPTLLSNRVNKIYGRQFVRGKAGKIGDLARIGYELLPELGGSDTVQKGLYAGGVFGILSNPVTAIPSIIGTLSTNRAYQSFINRNQSLVNKMLQGENISKEISKLSPKQAKTGLLISEEIKKIKTGVNK